MNDDNLEHPLPTPVPPLSQTTTKLPQCLHMVTIDRFHGKTLLQNQNLSCLFVEVDSTVLDLGAWKHLNDTSLNYYY